MMRDSFSHGWTIGSDRHAERSHANARRSRQRVGMMPGLRASGAPKCGGTLTRWSGECERPVTDLPFVTVSFLGKGSIVAEEDDAKLPGGRPAVMGANTTNGRPWTR